MRVAICLRGLCYGKTLNWKGISTLANYKKGFKNIIKHIVQNNPHIQFDFFLHGWVYDKTIINNIINDYKPVAYILEDQILFDQYNNLENYKEILIERFKHLKTDITTNVSINYRNYFQNIYSVSYSTMKTIELFENYSQEKSIQYDFAICSRFDIQLTKPINIDNLKKNKFYLLSHRSNSPVFYEDNFHISTPDKISVLKKMYDDLNNIYQKKDEFKQFFNYYNSKKHLYSGKFNHGMYTLHMMYSWFLHKQNIKYNDIDILDCERIIYKYKS